MEICYRAVLIGFLAFLQYRLADGGVAHCSREQFASSGTMREQMLARFRCHFNDKAKGYFEQPHETQPGNQVVMISKEDFPCNGHSMPYFYIEYVIPDVRPVDVFNVIADTLSQPKWLCDGCTISLIKNDAENQVQGFATAYESGLMERREFYQWQAYDANFQDQEFVVGAVSRETEELERMKAKESDTVVGRMCLSFTRISKTAGGTRIHQMSHFDPVVPMASGLFSMRNMYGTVWPMMLRRVPKIMAGAKVQASKNWPADRISIPKLFADIDDGKGNETHARLKVNVTTTGGRREDPKKTWFIVGAALFSCCCCCCSILLCWYFCGNCCSAQDRGFKPVGLNSDDDGDGEVDETNQDEEDNDEEYESDDSLTFDGREISSFSSSEGEDEDAEGEESATVGQQVVRSLKQLAQFG